MDLLLELLTIKELLDNSIDVAKIEPEKKDYDRAEGLRMRGKTFFGNNSPYESEASKMAKTIKDRQKLVRRAKAVAATYGTRDYVGLTNNGTHAHPQRIWKHFADALEKMGFNADEIATISKHKK